MYFIPNFQLETSVVVLYSLWSQGGGTSLTSSIRQVLSIASILEFYANCSMCLDRLLGQTVKGCWKTTCQSYRFQCSRLHKQQCGCFLLPWRLFCYVGSASNTAAALGVTFIRIIGKHPAMQSHIDYDMNPLWHCCKNLKTCIYTFYHKRNSLGSG